MFSLYFDRSGNQRRVYRFMSRRLIHSTTDRFNYLTNSLSVNRYSTPKQSCQSELARGSILSCSSMVSFG